MMKNKNNSNNTPKYSKINIYKKTKSNSLTKNVLNKIKNDPKKKEIPIIELLKCPICKKISLMNVNRDQLLFSFECNNNHIRNIEKSNTVQGGENISNISDLDISQDNLTILDKDNNSSFHNTFISSKNNSNSKIYITEKDFECSKHQGSKYHSYCYECKENICEQCLKEHLNHNKIELNTIKPKESEVILYQNDVKKKDEELNNIIDNIIKWQKEFEYGLSTIIKIMQNISNLRQFIILNYNPKQSNQNYNYIQNFNNMKVLNIIFPELLEFLKEPDWKQKGHILIEIIVNIQAKIIQNREKLKLMKLEKEAEKLKENLAKQEKLLKSKKKEENLEENEEIESVETGHSNKRNNFNTTFNSDCLNNNYFCRNCSRQVANKKHNKKKVVQRRNKSKKSNNPQTRTIEQNKELEKNLNNEGGNENGKINEENNLSKEPEINLDPKIIKKVQSINNNDNTLEIDNTKDNINDNIKNDIDINDNNINNSNNIINNSNNNDNINNNNDDINNIDNNKNDNNIEENMYDSQNIQNNINYNIDDNNNIEEEKNNNNAFNEIQNITDNNIKINNGQNENNNNENDINNNTFNGVNNNNGNSNRINSNKNSIDNLLNSNNIMTSTEEKNNNLFNMDEIKIDNSNIALLKNIKKPLENNKVYQNLELKYELTNTDIIRSIEFINTDLILISTLENISIYKMNTNYELIKEYDIKEFNYRINYATQLSDGNLIICSLNNINIIKLLEGQSLSYTLIQKLYGKNNSYNINKVIEIIQKNYLISCDKNNLIIYLKNKESNLYEEYKSINIDSEVKCLEAINENVFVTVEPEKECVIFYDIENNKNNFVINKIQSSFGRYVISYLYKHKCIFVTGRQGIYLISTEKYQLISFFKVNEWISSINYDYYNDYLICGTWKKNSINGQKIYNLIIFEINENHLENKSLDNMDIREIERKNNIHNHDIVVIKPSKEGIILTGSYDRTVKLWK